MKSTLTILIWLCAITAWSVPAQPVQKTVKGADGAPLTIVLRGDENYHFYTTLDGVPVVHDEANGCWVLAPQLADSLSAVWHTRLKARNARRTACAAAKRRSALAPNMTKRKGLVILVEFSDRRMKSTSTLAKFNQMFNQEGYSANNHQGSIHDYFYDQSYGALDLTFDIVGPVTAPKELAYYGKNYPDENGDDMHPAELVTEVCQIADKNYDLTWSDYDWDGDGEIEQVFIIYAGYGEQAGAPSYTLWAHEWTMEEAMTYNDGNGPFTLGGCTINTYAMTCELSSFVGSKMSGIGTACHEFSHCLGLPDFYNTNYTKGFGMNAWDLMSSGSSNGPSGNDECPAPFTAYERWFCGWLEPQLLQDDQHITDMPDLQDEPVAYLIRNEAYPTEYFLLENRQAKRWGSYIRTYSDMHGMLVCHVDEDEAAWANNTVNNSPSHQRMAIIPANQTYGSWMGSSYSLTAAQYRGQLFPGTEDVTTLDSLSHTLHGGTLFHDNTHGTRSLPFNITDITETDGLLSFRFSALDTPSSSISHQPQTPHAQRYYNLQGMPITHPVAPGIYLTHDKKKILYK